MLVTSQHQFDRLLQPMGSCPEVAIDCEFHREGRYYGRLCLVQIAFGAEVVAIDPFEVDLAPLGEVLAEAAVRKVLHAAENDLPLLAEATGGPIRNVFDTQIAAAFLGYGATPGYSTLVEKLCGVTLSKGARYTNWDARPLSAGQVEYALQDVRFLLPMAARLADELKRAGRLDWAAQETAEMVAKIFAPRDRSLLYLKLGPFKEMTRRSLAVLREVASWRDARAEKLNRPIQTIAPDEALRQLALEPPRTTEEIGRLRGLQRLGDGVHGLLAAVERGLSLPDAACPPPVETTVRDERADLIISLLATALRIRSNELKMAPGLIARRDQLEALLAWHDAGRIGAPPDVVRTGKWKRDAAGEMLLSVIEGRYSLGASPDAPDGVALISISPRS